MKTLTLLIVCLSICFSCSQDRGNKEGFNLSSGKLERLEHFKSKFVKPRNIDVWLPDNYSADQQYAVLYMHDGQMLFDSTKTWNKQEWGVDETMTQLLEAGKIRPTIVVGIWNNEFRHSEYFPQKPFDQLSPAFRDSLLGKHNNNLDKALFKTEVCSDQYLEFIVKELKPFIDLKYSTLSDVKNTFLAGSSMGGLISIYGLCEYPQVFSGAACLSTHWVGTFDTLNNPIPTKFAEYIDEKLPSARSHRIYFDFGTETLDALYEPYQEIVDSLLRNHSYTAESWKTLKFDGENHSENAWRKRLDIPLEFLLSKRHQ